MTPNPSIEMTKTYIALLRAVNAGGVNSLRMKDFVKLLDSMRLEHIKTYIQTGNAVFHAKETDAAGLPDKIKAGIQRSHEFELPLEFRLPRITYNGRHLGGEDDQDPEAGIHG